MHQPYYKDDKDAITFMPWVFLHAIKDYYDIPWYSENFPNIKATYNLVPSLLFQIESYINHSANDKLLEIMKKEIPALNHDEFEFLQSYLFLSNEKNMIKPLPRYHELFLKYKINSNIKEFEYQEILDCEVLFLLSWCGNYLRENNEIVQHLLEKQHFYSQQDKIHLIDSLIKFLPQILEYYKSLNDSGKITLCTTPYYHPITPLLLDINSAVEAKPHVTLPKVDSSFQALGEKNTHQAIEYFEKLFGKKPTGFWPAEGSVSLKTAKLFANNDLQWFCTDEEVLFKTIHNNEKHNIYKNYTLDIEGKTIDIRFRDHFLSDSIGFEYSNKHPRIAALEFIKHLENIYNSHQFSPLVNVILDGENAWEFFPHNAKEFFTELYTLLEELSWIDTVTMDEISTKEDIQNFTLPTLTSGSWINGNFDIWIGSDEKNRAWELLDLTMKDYMTFKETLDPHTNSLIEKEFMIALGSDWFWWYGDDHFTIQAKEFDELFRKHLINIYQYMELDTPSLILKPIIKTNTSQTFHTKPINFISPTIDGLKSNYFEWLGAGAVDISKEFSVMDGSKNIVQNILYGYDEENLYLFFEASFSKKHHLILSLNEEQFKFIPCKNNNIEGINSYCSKKSMELKVPKSIITPNDTNEISFSFTIKEEEKVLQTFPIYNDFIITLENCELHHWFV